MVSDTLSYMAKSDTIQQVMALIQAGMVFYSTLMVLIHKCIIRNNGGK